MTSEERKALRQMLIVLGFERRSYTDDIAGTGVYTETWERADNTATIAWGRRSADS
jgi:hypothetical protein